MTDAQMDDRLRGTALLAVSTALVKLHKEQFGRGPTHARTDFAGADSLVCTLEDAMLPAEHAMVKMGEQQRVREARTFLQVATADEFIATVEVCSPQGAGLRERDRSRRRGRVGGLHLRADGGKRGRRRPRDLSAGAGPWRAGSLANPGGCETGRRGTLRCR